jgi:hypothetical protein
MTKLRQKNSKSKTPRKTTKSDTIPTQSISDCFNTLAQLDKTPLNGSKQPFKNKLIHLQRRAKAKNLSSVIAYKCLDNCDYDFEKKEFWRMYYCSERITQKDGKLTTRFCNHRACIVCCRVRSAKLIAGYEKPLSELKNPYFVTLTVKNVPKEKLRAEIDKMMLIFNQIRKRATYLSKKGFLKMGILGIRKLEVTKKPTRNDYHPHFHFIVESGEIAAFLKIEWLKRYKGTDYKAQDIRKANDKTMFELFKYFTKMFTKEGVYTKPLMVMLKALKKRRVFQTLGLKKVVEVSEDVDDITSQIYEELDKDDTAIWQYIKSETDWINKETGELLSGYIPTDEEKQLTKIVY